MLSNMDYVKKYTTFKFWQIIIYGGIVVCLLVICLMIIGLFLGVISDYGRIFAFSSSMFVSLLYGAAILLYFPIKILSDIYTLRNSMKFRNSRK